jgi:hypothetical protein
MEGGAAHRCQPDLRRDRLEIQISVEPMDQPGRDRRREICRRSPALAYESAAPATPQFGWEESAALCEGGEISL